MLRTAQVLVVRLLETDLLVLLFVFGVVLGIYLVPSQIIIFVSSVLSVAFILDRMMGGWSFAFFLGSLMVVGAFALPALIISSIR